MSPSFEFYKGLYSCLSHTFVLPFPLTAQAESEEEEVQLSFEISYSVRTKTYMIRDRSDHSVQFVPNLCPHVDVCQTVLFNLNYLIGSIVFVSNNTS